MSKASDAGKQFLAGVLAKLPESLRTQAEAAFTGTEAEVALEVIGTGALAQPEINRKLDELKKQDDDLKAKLAEATALYERNTDWYQKNEAALKEYPTLKTKLATFEGGGGGGRHTEEEPPASLDKASIATLIEETIASREPGYVQVVAFMQDIGLKHLQTFGTPPNMMELQANPKLGKPITGQPGRVFGLQDAYNEKYGEQVAAKAKEARDKQINDEVEKRLADRLKDAGNGHPFPMRGQPSPSVLDVLDTKEGTAAHTLDSAVALYESLQGGRGL